MQWEQQPAGNVTLRHCHHFRRLPQHFRSCGSDRNRPTKGPDLQNMNDNKNKFVYRRDHFRRSQNTKQPENRAARKTGGVHAQACGCDPENAEVSDPISLNSSQISKKEVVRSPLPLPHVWKSAEGITDLQKSRVMFLEGSHLDTPLRVWSLAGGAIMGVSQETKESMIAHSPITAK